MSRWLVSWQQPRDQTFSLIFPWWRGATDVAGRQRITAAIIAADEAAAREAVIEVQFGTEPIMWNFVSRRSDDWHPFTEARPREDWMVWPEDDETERKVCDRSTSMFARALERPESAANEAPAHPCKTEGCENPGAVVALSGGHYCWECLKFSSATLVLQDAPDPRVSPKALARQAVRAEIGAAIDQGMTWDEAKAALERSEADGMVARSTGSRGMKLTEDQVTALAIAVADRVHDRIHEFARGRYSKADMEDVIRPYIRDADMPDSDLGETIEVFALVRVDRVDREENPLAYSIAGWTAADDDALRDQIDEFASNAGEWTEEPRWSKIRARVPVPPPAVTVDAEVE